MKMFKHLLLETRNDALWIFLNRPDLKNAFSLEMADEFLQAIHWGLKSTKHSILVVSGKGDAFSAGGDIKRMNATKDLKGFFLKISKLVHTAVVEMRQGSKPVLASIPGYVGGIAFGMVLGTDLRIASTEAQFCAATIRLGLVANGSATYHLPRLIGFTRASDLLLTGRVVSATEAFSMGLINKVVPPEKLAEETQKLVDQLSSSPRQTLARVKKILYQSLSSTLPVQLERERQSIAWSATTPDFQEGMKAFLEKRKPQFNILRKKRTSSAKRTGFNGPLGKLF